MNANIPPAAGSSRPSVVNGTSRFRTALFSYAVLLAAGGAWLLASDLLRPRPHAPPPDRASATTVVAPSNLYLAAQIGMVRGDLWADAAVVEAATLPGRERSAPIDRGAVKRLDRARAAMEASLALAPVNAEGWLLLAKLPSASGNVDSRVASLLEMAYFTAPNAVALAPRRLERAATSSALSDLAIQDFVKTDIRRLLAGTAQPKAAIVAAYQSASPENRTTLESLVAEIDPDFAKTLRTAQPR
jgi:hypothetical protein